MIAPAAQGQRAFDNLLFGGFERGYVDFEKEAAKKPVRLFQSNEAGPQTRRDLSEREGCAG